MSEISEYAIFLAVAEAIYHNGTRLGTLELLRADLPNEAIIPVEEVPENWQEMTIANGQLVPASAEVLAARRQAEIACAQANSPMAEKKIIGKTWVGHDGVERQVFGRHFQGTIPESDNNTRVRLLLAPDISSLFWATGFVSLSEGGRGRIGQEAYVDYKNYLAIDLPVSPADVGCPYYVYAEYTKL